MPMNHTQVDYPVCEFLFDSGDRFLLAIAESEDKGSTVNA
jgi:hypothetical protein